MLILAVVALVHAEHTRRASRTPGRGARLLALTFARMALAPNFLDLRCELIDHRIGHLEHRPRVGLRLVQTLSARQAVKYRG